MFHIVSYKQTSNFPEPHKTFSSFGPGEVVFHDDKSSVSEDSEITSAFRALVKPFVIKQWLYHGKMQVRLGRKLLMVPYGIPDIERRENEYHHDLNCSLTSSSWPLRINLVTRLPNMLVSKVSSSFSWQVSSPYLYARA